MTDAQRNVQFAGAGISVETSMEDTSGRSSPVAHGLSNVGTTTRRRMTALVQIDEKLQHATEPKQRFGSLRFPSSKAAPARWLSVPIPRGASHERLQSVSKELRKMMTGDDPRCVWNLPPPSAVISVTGGAQSLELTDKQKLVFRHGLQSAATRAKAWIFDGGTNYGVMELVGKTMQDSPGLPCIGVAPWGVVHKHENMLEQIEKKKYPGLVFAYDGQSEHEAKSREDRSEVRVALDPHHSHFILVDDGFEGFDAFQGEIALRAELEHHICEHAFIDHGDAAGLGAAKSAPPPMVVLVVGGGKGTLITVRQSLRLNRPALVFTDSGGAARWLRDYWEVYERDAQAQVERRRRLKEEARREAHKQAAKQGGGAEARPSAGSAKAADAEDTDVARRARLRKALVEYREEYGHQDEETVALLVHSLLPGAVAARRRGLSDHCRTRCPTDRRRSDTMTALAADAM